MIEDIVLSQELQTFIGSEPKDFAAQAGRVKTFKSAIGTLSFGVIWIIVVSVITYIFTGPLFFGEEVHFKVNGMPMVASPDNLEPIIPVVIILGVFILVGFVMLAYGIYSFLAKGSVFVGTSSGLVIQRGKNIRSINWEQFNGDIQVSKVGEKGDIVMRLRTGKMVSRKNRSPQYVPDTISIPAIPNTLEIEQICRKRIKENDPTPVGGQSQESQESFVERRGI